ncbi:MAG TPA: FecR domain-containing protein [Polyangiaceae bacterium]|nr:FecR domain-containing protein [Polyangiaceae bacterium]
MNSPRYARIAARLLAEEPLLSVELSDSKRAQAIDVIAQALAAKTRRRARRVWISGIASVAAAGLLGYAGIRQFAGWGSAPNVQAVSAVVRPTGSGSAILDQAGKQALLSPLNLQQGGRLVAGGTGGASVRLSTGTELAVEHDTNLEFENAGPVERFFLSQGVLQAKVAKLRDGQRFIVRTPDAEVEVRGTAFRVSIVEPDANCANGARTRVSVSEGIVEVRGAGASTYVHPGETWPAGCTLIPAVATDSTRSAAPALALQPTPLKSDRTERASSVSSEQQALEPAQRPAKEASSIAQQNELFAEANAARQQGDSSRAVSYFEQLIARYPSSPLAEGAAVQRMILLAGMNPAAGRSAARQYLVRYPQGYAKNDAEKLAQP